jgi:hypothetical protein
MENIFTANFDKVFKTHDAIMIFYIWTYCKNMLYKYLNKLLMFYYEGIFESRWRKGKTMN